MNEKNTQRLLKTYTALYRQHSLPMSETCMCWLFCCGDGWFKIIDLMSKRLTAYAKRHNVAVECTQVKEKYGTLRVYLNVHNDATDKIVEAATAESSKTCEECGKPGKMGGGGWVSVKCPACRQKARRRK